MVKNSEDEKKFINNNIPSLINYFFFIKLFSFFIFPFNVQKNIIYSSVSSNNNYFLFLLLICLFDESIILGYSAPIINPSPKFNSLSADDDVFGEDHFHENAIPNR